MKKSLGPILSVRFKIPEPRKNYVVRKALYNKLEHINNKEVTIIKGGAGSGKTTLLSSYVKENNIKNVKWLSIDKSMNGVFIYWKYIIENSKEFLGDSANLFEENYSANMQKENLWDILSLFINILFDNEEIIYVLDDFQNITDEFLLKTIEFFIKNMSNNIHIVIITREMPNLYLGTLSMEDNLLLIEDEDVRMTVEESQNFLRNTLNLKLNDEEIKDIVNKSNGWVGGLQLMAMAKNSKKGNQLINVNSSKKVIEEYITNEVYNYLTEEEKEFLLKTAIPSYFNEEFYKKLFKKDNFNSMMESILNKNLFVISISNEENVYRYHSIMKDYLNEIINKSDKKVDIYLEESRIFEELGDNDESINLLFEIDQYEILMEKLLAMPQNVVTSSYIMKVPINEIKKNINFAYQYFFNYYISLDSDECEKIYNMIIENFKDEDSFKVFKNVDLFFSVERPFQKKTIIPLEEVDSLKLNMITKAYLLILQAYLLFMIEDYEKAFKYLGRAEEIYNATNNSFIKILIILERAMMYEEYGELNKAIAEYKDGEELVANMKGMRVSHCIGIVGVYLKMLDIKNAEENLRNAKKYLIANNENLKDAYLYNYAELLYIKGDYKQTEEIVMNLLNKEIYKNPLYICRLLRYKVIRENHQELIDKFLEAYKKEDNDTKTSDTELLYAELLFEKGKVDEAIKISNRVIVKARKNQNKYKIIEADLIKIKFLFNDENNKEELINKFIELVSYSYKCKIALLIWYKKDIVIKMLNKYKEEIYNKLSKHEIEFLESILNFKCGEDIYDSNNYNLTSREIEVLKEMEKGLTNKEIADILCISLATVKSHIINIYGKLSVNNRVAAMNKYGKIRN